MKNKFLKSLIIDILIVIVGFVLMFFLLYWGYYNFHTAFFGTLMLVPIVFLIPIENDVYLKNKKAEDINKIEKICITFSIFALISFYCLNIFYVHEYFNSTLSVFHFLIWLYISFYRKRKENKKDN